MRFVICAALALQGLPAIAGCAGGENLVSCPMADGVHHLETCLQGEQVVYRYTRAGAEELVMARDVEAVDMVPWPGVGRSIWEEFTLENNGYLYTVWFSFERMYGDEEVELQPVEGGVVIKLNGQELAALDCAAGQVEATWGLALYEAKVAAGQSWDRNASEWVPAN